MKTEQWVGVCVRFIRFLQWNWKIWEYICLYSVCSRLTLNSSVAPANTYQIHFPAVSMLRAAAAVTASHFWQSVSTSNLCHCRQPTQLRPLLHLTMEDSFSQRLGGTRLPAVSLSLLATKPFLSPT